MHLKRTSKTSGGWALMLVSITMCVAVLLLGAAMAWVSSSSKLTARNNDYQAAVYAADAAVERVIGSMQSDYYRHDYNYLAANVSSYRSATPSTNYSAYWSRYQFTDGTSPNTVKIQSMGTTAGVAAKAPYTGLKQDITTYQIIANAKDLTVTAPSLIAAVGQEVNFAETPLFQFAIFYQNELEINPGANMTIAGAVHGNDVIYLNPAAILTFSNTVTASGEIYQNKDPNDPSVRTGGTVAATQGISSSTTPLTLPVGLDQSLSGTNSASTINSNLLSILDIPPSDEDPSSLSGKNRYYNKAGLVILISNNTVSVTSPNLQNPVTNWSSFLNTNVGFYNAREGMNVQGVDLDIAKLTTWLGSSNNSAAIPSSSGGVIYIADFRSTNINPVQVTNTTSVTSYVVPTAGTYLGSIVTNQISTNATTRPSTPPAVAGSITTNSTSTVSMTYPNTGTYVGAVTTNTATSSSYPSPGTYIGVVSTNTTLTTSSSSPAPGTYTGTPTYNNSTRKYTYYKITGYTYATGYKYNLITGYSFNVYSYTYNQIVGTSTQYTSVEPGIRVINGSKLPSPLTIATPDPLYVKGNFNTTDSYGTSTGADTTHTSGASLVADAVTILSSNWNDANSTNYSSRTATETTVNAAILAGNVSTTPGQYSGGVENFPRFLENWDKVVINYNGSMVCMFSSRYAKAPWGGSNVYAAPTRKWAFDNNFLTASKRPPGCPGVLNVYRSRWSTLAPNSASF